MLCIKMLHYFPNNTIWTCKKDNSPANRIGAPAGVGERSAGGIGAARPGARIRGPSVRHTHEKHVSIFTLRQVYIVYSSDFEDFSTNVFSLSVVGPTQVFFPYVLQINCLSCLYKVK